MKVQVLHIDACPNWREAGARVRQTLDSLGLSTVPVEYVLIGTQEEAETTEFGGSPTILVDGKDLFPSPDSTNDLACRIYFTEHGLAGTPSNTQLEAAVRSRV